MKLIRNISYSKEDWLWYLFNKLGYSELAVCNNYTGTDGEMYFSKWITYNELLYLGPSYKKNIIIKRATHRTILDIEIMFDIDDLIMPIGNSKFKFASIELKSKFIFQKLKELGKQPVVYFTGNKSYHISIIIPELRRLSNYQRSNYKEKILKKFGGDLMKKSNRCMISMEDELHYRSGKPKSRVHW